MNPIEIRFNKAAKFLSASVVFIGMLGLSGWVFDISFLRHIIPGAVDIKVNTTLCLILLGSALGLCQWTNHVGRFRRILFLLCVLLALSIGVITIAEYFLGYSLSIDQLLFKESETAILTSSPGRMALNTAIAFTVASVAAIFSCYKKKLATIIAQSLAVLVLFMGLLSYVGYIYNADPLYIGLQYSTAMAVHTAVGLIFLGTAILFATSGGLMNVIAGEGVGSQIFRRIFPVSILLPILLGWGELRLEENNILNEGLRTTLSAILNTTIISGYLFSLSSLMNKEDRKRKKAEELLRTGENLLKESQAIANLGSYVLDIQTGTWEGLGALDNIFGTDKGHKHSLEEWSAVVHPDERAEMINYLNNEVIGKRTFFDREYRIVRLTDHVERWVHGVGKLEFDEQGVPIKMYGTIQDVTEDKTREDATKGKLDEIQKLNSFMTGRELKMAELKKENEELKKKLVDK